LIDRKKGRQQRALPAVVQIQDGDRTMEDG